MRVLVIDDHALFRIGLSELLERRGIQVIAAVSGCEEGLNKVMETQPDVVLLDMRMPQMTGLQVLERLRADGWKKPVSMLTTSRDESDVLSSLQNGAQGYLLKDMEPDELINALERIVQGETVVAQELTGILARAVQGGSEPVKTDKEMPDLTPREQEILCLLAEGQSNKVIARNLGISDGTVKLHVKAILRKMGVHSRVEAAVLAVENNMCGRA